MRLNSPVAVAADTLRGDSGAEITGMRDLRLLVLTDRHHDLMVLHGCGHVHQEITADLLTQSVRTKHRKF